MKKRSPLHLTESQELMLESAAVLLQGVKGRPLTDAEMTECLFDLLNRRLKEVFYPEKEEDVKAIQ